MVWSLGGGAEAKADARCQAGARVFGTEARREILSEGHSELAGWIRLSAREFARRWKRSECLI